MNPSRLFLCLVALLALPLLGATSAQAQNGLEFLGQGAKAAGRGGASTALPDDALSITRNPALLTELPGTRLDTTIILRHERTRRRNAKGENELDSSTTLWPIPIFSLATDLRDDGPDAASGRGPYLAFGLHQPMMGIVAPTATVAFKVTDRFSIGLSVNVLLSALAFKSGGRSKGGGPSPVREFRPAGGVRLHYQPDGTPIDPPQPFDPGTGRQLTWADVFDVGFQTVAPVPGQTPTSGSSEPIVIDYELEHLFGAGIAAQLGFLWTPRDDLSLALSVRTPGIVFSPKGRGTIDFGQAVETLERNPAVGLLVESLIDTALPNRGEEGYDSDYKIELDDVILPASVSLGVAWWPLPRWVLTLDLRWIGWSHALDEITIHATGGDNEDLNEVAGGSSIRATIPLDWRDQFVVAVGTTVAVNDWLLLRAGYNHGDNPIPSNGTVTNSAVIEDHLSVGVGLRLGSWDVDLAYAYGLPKRVDMPGASFRVELHQVFIGVGYEF